MWVFLIFILATESCVAIIRYLLTFNLNTSDRSHMYRASFTARMPLLTATRAIGLGRRCWCSPQQCYLDCFRMILNAASWLVCGLTEISTHTNVTLYPSNLTSQNITNKFIKHREPEKRIEFSFVCTFSSSWQELENFFTYIKEHISYNVVIYFWHALRILCSNEIETINTSR